MKEWSDDKLIKLALQSLEFSFQDRDEFPSGLPTQQQTVSGVFVTLERAGRLRGCKGCVEGNYPLLSTIWRVARNSAFEDPRFNPLREEELEDLELSISILSPMKLVEVQHPSEYGQHLRLGIDGISLKLGKAGAIFLPEVAMEQDWDIETTLSNLCKKAGIDKEEWRNPATEIFRFNTHQIPASSKKPL